MGEICYNWPMKTTLYTHEDALLHDTGPGHPERPERLSALLSLFSEIPFADWPQRRAVAAGTDHLLYAHPQYYIDMVENVIPAQDHLASIEGDTILSHDSWEAALRAAGAVCEAVSDIASGKTVRAFCAMRPPGHHAEPARSMGFCLFNNIFIGARHAQVAHGLKKIAIVDFDVHHGNGTDAMTRAHDGSILFISTHQFPLWPMSGLPEDNEACVKNFTLPAGADGAAFQRLYKEKVLPEVDKFAPDLLMISAGFDGHRDDPLAQWNLLEEDYAWVTKELCRLAAKHCGGKVISVLEGGYHLDALKSSVAAHLKALSA